jgi:hypothetical protein
LLTRYSLALEKCLQPRKPRWADSGDGCTASSTQCRLRSTHFAAACGGRTCTHDRDGHNDARESEGAAGVRRARVCARHHQGQVPLCTPNTHT